MFANDDKCWPKQPKLCCVVWQYDGSPPVYFTVESPSSLRRGETVGLRLFGINNMDREVMALIILLGSPDYFFVQTDKKGHSRSYDPSLVRGEHHHMVIVRTFLYLYLMYVLVCT